MKNKTVLILDDEEDICFLLGNFLKKEFKKVYTAYSIEDYSQYNLEEIDVMIVDNNLHDGYGFDIIPSIKSAKPSMKIIAVSAFDANNERKYAMENGADLFIGKPFNFQDILASIDAIKK